MGTEKDSWENWSGQVGEHESRDVVYFVGLGE